MKKIYALISCLLFIISVGNASAAEYSLDDLYRLALERSETIKLAEETLYISEKEKDRAVSTLVPTFSAFGKHTKYSEEKRTSSSLLLQPDRTNEWGLRLDQSLSLSGRELTALEIAKQGIRKGKSDLNSVKEEYLLNVASAYYDVLKAQKALDIANTNVARLTKHRDASRKRLEVGEATKTVVLRAEAELSGAQSDQIRSGNALVLAKAVLARTVGISGEFNIIEPEQEKIESLSISHLIGECTLPEMDCLKEKAFAGRSEIRALSMQNRIAENEVKYAKGTFWPDLSLEGVYLHQKNKPVSSTDVEERIYGIIRLDFPFFEGGLRVAEVSQAKAKLRQAEYTLADMKKSVGIEIEDAYLTLQTNASIISMLEAEVSYAKDNYNSVSKQFQYGLADSIDIIDANTLLTNAEKKLANAEYDYQYAILILNKAAGTLLNTIADRD